MLGVRDLAAAVAFYRDMLGLTVKQETPGFAFLDGGGVTLALSQPLARSAAQISGATERSTTVLWFQYPPSETMVTLLLRRCR